MYYPFSWIRSLFRTLLVFAVAALIGAYFNAVYSATIIAALLLLLLNFWQLYRLNRWLWHSKKLTPPNTSGDWAYIYDGIYYMQRRNRRKRKKLSNLVKRFREGSEALPDAAVVVDANSAIVWCNRLARIDLGLKWPQDIGRRIDNLIRHPKFVEFFRAGKYDNPVEVPSPYNVQKIFEYRVMPYGDKHLLLIARDVTRLKQLEQMRKDFVANVSHELRTPLTVLNGYLEMLPHNEHVSPELLSKAFKEMSAQSIRMQSLVDQLLVLSRIEASGERVFEKVVDMPKMLTLVETEVQALNKELGHNILFNVDPNLKVYGIETELRSACSNLIFNAIHYTPAPGNITISWKLIDGQACFAVEDDGEGIPEKHLHRLTERFYRVDRARSRKTGGSGLGLSIVKHVLTHHNSRLEIDSEVGQGSVFSFRLSHEVVLSSPDLRAESAH